MGYRRLDIVARTLAKLRADGWTARVAESSSGYQRVDLFGIADIVALKGTETMAVQVAGPGERLSHTRKIADAEDVDAVRDANWRIQLWTWSKVRKTLKDGSKGKAKIWKVRIDDLS